MENNDRYCLACPMEKYDDVYNGLKKLGAHIVAASYSDDKLLILYKGDKNYELEEVLNTNEVV